MFYDVLQRLTFIIVECRLYRVYMILFLKEHNILFTTIKKLNRPEFYYPQFVIWPDKWKSNFAKCS